MKTLRQVGSIAFVAGLFVTLFGGVPWHVIVADDPAVPMWLRVAIFCLLSGFLVVLGTLAYEQLAGKPKAEPAPAAEETVVHDAILTLNSDAVPGRPVITMSPSPSCLSLPVERRA